MTLDPEHVWFGRHAQERLREHYPNMGVRGARVLLEQATEVPTQLAATLLGRSPDGEKTVRSRYFLVADRRGMLVLASDRIPEGSKFTATCVTYIRFPEAVHEQVDRIFTKAA